MIGDMHFKVCGMTRAGDVAMCQELGADFLGFIFHPGSPRNVTPDFAASFTNLSAKKVGVFVGQDVHETARTMEDAALDLAQLHGDQNQDFCRIIGPHRVVKVLWPTRYASRDGLARDLERFAPVCSMFLFDSGVGGGGHGQGFDVSPLKGLDIPHPWLLAGGIGPGTAAPLLDEIRPYGLDINSGVESAPGIKDRGKLAATLEIVKQRQQ